MSTLDEQASQLLQRAIRLFCAYDYSADDICTVLAHACAYFQDYRQTPAGRAMGQRQAVHIFIVHTYLAHSFLMDEAVHLKTWHAELSKDYCTLSLLNSVVVKLMKARDYRLLLSDNEVCRRYDQLVAACLSAPQGGSELGCADVNSLLPQER